MIVLMLRVLALAAQMMMMFVSELCLIEQKLELPLQV
jgi:hypothetical protein